MSTQGRSAIDHAIGMPKNLESEDERCLFKQQAPLLILLLSPSFRSKLRVLPVSYQALLVQAVLVQLLLEVLYGFTRR